VCLDPSGTLGTQHNCPRQVKEKFVYPTAAQDHLPARVRPVGFFFASFDVSEACVDIPQIKRAASVKYTDSQKLCRNGIALMQIMEQFVGVNGT
jgi:hypothetical protein